LNLDSVYGANFLRNLGVNDAC